MLKVDKVSAGYGNLQILTSVSIDAQPGEVTVIVGPNGSGKSTLLKTIAGLTNLYSGRITLATKEVLLDLTRLAPHEIARNGIAYLPQTESTFTHLTVAENLKMAGYTVRREALSDRLEKALEIFPRLSAYMNTKVLSLSGGERQMVAMAMALLRKPNVIMFDEPTALASDSGIVILLVEQNATRALQIGHRAHLLVNGQTIFNGTAKELLEHRELGRLYLGLKVTQPTDGDAGRGAGLSN